MRRDFLISVTAGLLSAVLYLSTTWSILGALVFALFTPFPLLAAGLGLGLTAAAIATVISTLTVILVLDGIGMVVFAVVYALPAVMVVRLALLQRTAEDGTVEWYPPGLLLNFITLYAVAVFIVVDIFMGSGSGGLRAEISSYVDSMRDLVVDSQRNNTDVTLAFDAIKRIFPFIAAAWWMMVVVVNSILAQRLLERRGLNRRPGPDLRTTSLPVWLAGVMVAATVTALLGSGWLGFVGTNVALILCVPYFFVGLAVLHTVSAQWGARTAILIATYVVLLLFSRTAVLVAGIGFLEHWTDLRRRFGGPSGSQERKE